MKKSYKKKNKKKPNIIINIRYIALNILNRFESEERSIRDYIKEYAEKNQLNGIDISFLRELTYGTVKMLNCIDYVIDQFSKKKLKSIDSIVLNILRLGVYQIMFLDKIPKSAAVNESVKLSYSSKRKYSSGFINGILRTVAGNHDNIKWPDRKKDFKTFCKIVLSHPLWIVNKLINDFGTEVAFKIMIANNSQPPLTVRVNTCRVFYEDCVRFLEKDFEQVKKGLVAKDSLILTRPLISITQTKAFKNGWIFIQDEASQLISLIADPKENQIIYDACCAPGGKATYLAQLASNKASIFCGDNNYKRFNWFNENLKRMGTENIYTCAIDSAKSLPFKKNSFNLLLLDAPCSALGLLRRHSEARWVKSEEDIGEAVKNQKELLENLCDYVSVGGSFVYSVCTFTKEEGVDQIKGFLKSHHNFKLVPLNIDNVEKLQGVIDYKDYLWIHQVPDGPDGYFAAKMVRTG